MTAFVVDTDVAPAILKARLREHLETVIAGRRLAITFVTVGELAQWTHLHRGGPARRAGLSAFFRSVLILSATVDAAIIWGDIHAADGFAAGPDRSTTAGSLPAAGPRTLASDAQHQGLRRLRRVRRSSARPMTIFVVERLVERTTA